MPDTKITALTAITTVDPAVDVLPIVDVSDTTMAASGTTKKITSNQILGAGCTATLASATITGDLTVDTSTLKVDSANNRVGIGTASPNSTLEVAGSIRTTSSTGSATASIGVFDYVAGTTTRLVSYGANTTTAGAFQFVGLSSNASVGDIRYAIDATGVATWSNVGGVAGTAMTLNSTGLGVGATPSAWSGIGPALQVEQASLVSESSNQLYLTANGYFAGGQWNYINNASADQYYQVSGSHVWRSGTGGSPGTAIGWSTLMTLNSTGLGVGVSPSYQIHARKDQAAFTTIAIDNQNAIAAGTGAQFLLIDGGVNAGWFRRTRDGLGNTDIGYKDTLRFRGAIAGTERTDMLIDASGNVVVGTAAIATTATNGFLYVTGCAGTPTGTPTTQTGRVPLVVDTTNNKLYFYSGGSWVAAN